MFLNTSYQLRLIPPVLGWSTLTALSKHHALQMISWTSSLLHHFEVLLAYDHQLTMAGNLYQLFYVWHESSQQVAAHLKRIIFCDCISSSLTNADIFTLPSSLLSPVFQHSRMTLVVSSGFIFFLTQCKS